MAVVNNTGRGGKSFQDRETAARVRNLALSEIEKILKNPKSKLYAPVLIKLAGTVLPRLNEHTGNDGEPLNLKVQIVNGDKLTSDHSLPEESTESKKNNS